MLDLTRVALRAAGEDRPDGRVLDCRCRVAERFLDRREIERSALPWTLQPFARRSNQLLVARVLLVEFGPDQ